MEGVVLLGRYAITGKIGQGGMGLIYKATNNSPDRRIPRDVAIKIMKDCGDEGLANRFIQEVKTVAEVEHPNVIRIFDVDQYKGMPFMVLEYLHGTDLRQRVRQDGPLGWEQARNISSQICDGVGAVHALGILHRDLKSQNVFITNEGVVKVLDFGLAKFFTDSTKNVVETQADMFAGTPEVSSPESINDRDHMGTWSDVYAMGVIMYQMVTGVVPFTLPAEAENANLLILNMHVNQAPVPPREKRPDLGIPQAVESIILKCLAKDHRERYPDMRALRKAVLQCDAGVGKKQPGEPGVSTLLLAPEHDARRHTSGRSTPRDAVPKQAPRISGEDAAVQPGKKGGAGRLLKGAALAGATMAGLAGIAAAAYMALATPEQFRQRYDGVVGKAVEEATRIWAAGPEPAAPAGSKANTAQQAFTAVIDSDPSGASVYDVTAGRPASFLGVTPLRRELPVQGKDYDILVSAGRRSDMQKRIALSPAHPMETVILGKGKRAGKAQPGADTRAGYEGRNQEGKEAGQEGAGPEFLEDFSSVPGAAPEQSSGQNPPEQGQEPESNPGKPPDKPGENW
jgi:serine/threonine-protein kinase